MPYQAGSSAQRIRIGLTGLAFAFLLVLLGSIISRSSTSESAHQRGAAGSVERAERAAGRAWRWLPAPPQQQRQLRQMSRARLRAWLLALLVAIGAGGLAYAVARQATGASLPPRAAGQRPTLLLLTSLPLVFGEQFSIEGGGSPALKALETRYRVVPISVTDRGRAGEGPTPADGAAPRAAGRGSRRARSMGARAAARVLLLADPLLEWPSERPLGDPLRPPPMFMDTGLLGHWGLKLDAPDQRGPRRGRLGGYDIMTESPGSLSGAARSARDRLVAHCRVGQGRATIVADADFLNVERLGRPARHNLDALLGELALLERK